MSLTVPTNLTVAVGVGAVADASKSGYFRGVPLELIFEIAESDLGLADVLAFALTNKDLFRKVITRFFVEGMKKNKAPLRWACINDGGPAILDAIAILHPRGRQHLSGYFEHKEAIGVYDHTPLIVAIRAANLGVVKRLLKYGVNANQPERSASSKTAPSSVPVLWRPIHFAVGYNLIRDGLPQRLGNDRSPRVREDVVEYLLQTGAVDVEELTEATDPCAIMSPLFLHTLNGTTKIRAGIVRHLLKHGAEATRPMLYRVAWMPETIHNVSPLSLLLAECRRDHHVSDEVMTAVTRLIRAGSCGRQDTWSGAPLLIECLNPCEDMRWFQLAEMMLSSGLESAICATGINGEPTVPWLITRLLEFQLWFQYDYLYATKMEKQNKYNTARGCTYRMLQLLLRHGADINARCPVDHGRYPGATALIIAGSLRDELNDVFLDLLESGADTGARDSRGQTACFALFAGQLSNPNDRIQALSEAGAPMNATDDNGDTVLHYAARNSRRHFSNWLPKLLAHGCDLQKRNNQNETVVDVLCQDARPEQRGETRRRVLEDIRQARHAAVKIKRQERKEKYRMRAAAAAEQRRERDDAARAAQAATQAGRGTCQPRASTAQTGHNSAQVGPSTAQVGPSTGEAGFTTISAGPSTAFVGFGLDHGGNVGSGAPWAGANPAPATARDPRLPAQGVRRNATNTTHQPVQAGSNTPRPYPTAAQVSLGTAHAGSRTVTQAGPRATAQAGPATAWATTQVFPGAAPSCPSMDNRPPGFW